MRSGSSSATFQRNAVISVYGTGDKAIYTSLTDASHTRFQFTFNGHSDAANQGVSIKLDLGGVASPSFTQTVTSDTSGDWQLVVQTPMGMDLMNRAINLTVQAQGGSHTLSSMTITPQLSAVPEPTGLALSVLGLAGLAVVGRRRR